MAGVYVSYPFCGQKCTFCNFVSGVYPRSVVERYLAAVRSEIQRHTWLWRPETVYIGGGSPGNLEATELEALIEPIPGRPWAEATVEAPPGCITLEKARDWSAMGLNRVSLGVQSFAAGELARTGRRHTAGTVEADMRLLREAGIANFNVDLIAGLPGQTPDSWRESLDWVEKLEAPHVSVYMLEIDEDSRLGGEILRGGTRYGAGDTPPEEVVVELYETAVERLARMGLARYEISNFARPGFESRHNLKYWRLEPYAGFGADAHSFDTETRRQNVDSPQEYLSRFERGEPVSASAEPARPEEEKFFVGLRLSGGIQPTREEWRRFELPLQRFLDAGLVEIHGENLRLTGRGVLLSNEVFQEFIGL
jgi:oxygen-independent coproporphyrinogen-3 oxidase